MFTSFKFSSQLSLPRGKVFPSSNRVQQKHTVDIVGPQKLLSARISILLDALKHEIIDLQILRLSPWAERELGTFMRSKATERDLGNVCWAIESYLTIAVKRARYWHKCEQAFAHLIAGSANEDTENTRVHQTKSSQSMSRKDLNRHLGRDVLVLQDKHVLLKLNWRISFDWTGEAESEINVDTAFPSVCKYLLKTMPRVTSHADHIQGRKRILLRTLRRSPTRLRRFCAARACLKQRESWLPCCSRSRINVLLTCNVAPRYP